MNTRQLHTRVRLRGVKQRSFYRYSNKTDNNIFDMGKFLDLITDKTIPKILFVGEATKTPQCLALLFQLPSWQGQARKQTVPV